ncbi:hypothetical protein CYMTET_31118 [Cymbomonas tetramitiformis]|uniref:Uncharacterized protein n=1 Tax=Cymbomonas tetramitiformis TaxID=36881 RepID=A0AAE0FI16_9CHLO|nr:hypothetical protein CYMTET_31118 [Cymbomonas tetramitiformis]
MTHSGDWLMQAELEKAMELGGLAEKLQESLQREKRETARLAEALESADLQLEVQIRAFSKAKQQGVVIPTYVILTAFPVLAYSSKMPAAARGLFGASSPGQPRICLPRLGAQVADMPRKVKAITAQGGGLQEAEKVQQAIKQREDSEAVLLQALEEKGEEVQQLQQQMGSLVLEAGSLKKETEKAAADWEKKELKKYKQKIAQLEEETQAKSEVLQKAEETVGTHVHMLVNAKLELAEQAGRNEELRNHIAKLKICMQYGQPQYSTAMSSISCSILPQR